MNMMPFLALHQGSDRKLMKGMAGQGMHKSGITVLTALSFSEFDELFRGQLQIDRSLLDPPSADGLTPMAGHLTEGEERDPEIDFVSMNLAKGENELWLVNNDELLPLDEGQEAEDQKPGAQKYTVVPVSAGSREEEGGSQVQDSALSPIRSGVIPGHPTSHSLDTLLKEKGSQTISRPQGGGSQHAQGVLGSTTVQLNELSVSQTNFEAAEAGFQPREGQLTKEWSKDNGLKAPSGVRLDAQLTHNKGLFPELDQLPGSQPNAGGQARNMTVESPLGQQERELNQTSEVASKPADLNQAQNAKSASEKEFSPAVVRYQSLVYDLQHILRLKGLRMKEGEVTQLRVKIHPEHLGALDIRLVSQKGKMTIQLLATNRFAVEALDRHLYQLQAVLAQLGFQIERLEVTQQPLSQTLHEDQYSHGNQHHDSQESNQGRSRQTGDSETVSNKITKPELGYRSELHQEHGSTVDYIA
ncbi:flagellar hook-length control protein [Caldalkalibacillus thermarum TA2.A1]|uniref:Flagellar hook-length control protein n=2 Tax=Caldalkalibacillus TaxID=379065 RepID=F5L811_CALTT|nr:flagellar hook-length control protein [Caldalkalibacillus thermarum TA2.A1]QZT33016.1 flagellar hook-length control protein FliK [Caldalkalibacillus thermarum TA2.A1]